MFECKHCVYKTPYHSSFKSHLNSKKHTKIIEINHKVQYGTSETIVYKFYKCKKCCKPYFSYSGLWGHTKQCEWDYTRLPPPPPSLTPNSYSLSILSPTPLQINDIIKGFFNNTNNKRMDTQLCKKKTKEMNSRLKKNSYGTTNIVL